MTSLSAVKRLLSTRKNAAQNEKQLIEVEFRQEIGKMNN